MKSFDSSKYGKNKLGNKKKLNLSLFSYVVVKEIKKMKTSISFFVYSYASFAVDGSAPISYQFYHSEFLYNPWFLVDLEDRYRIKAVRILPRQDYTTDNRFIQIAVSNTFF